MSRAAYFISDMHLGSAGAPPERERRVVSFLERVAADADSLYIVGDGLDFWWEYRTVVPRGHTRFFGALARLSDGGCRITWLRGNHDVWFSDYLSTELGIRVHDGILTDEVLGARMLLEHGDGVGQQPTSYRVMRRLFRARWARIAYGALHPRWGVPLALRMSHGSRTAGQSRPYDDSARRNLLSWADEYARTHTPAPQYFVFGHIHHASVDRLAAGPTAVFLGDWLTHATYARYDGTRMQLLEYR